MSLIVNPGMAVHPYHGESKQPTVVCEVPDASGRPRRYLVPQQLCDLLSVCDGTLARTVAVEVMAKKSGGVYTIGQMEQLANNFLIARQLLLDSEGPKTPVIAAPRLDRYLFCKVRILRRTVVLPIVSRLDWLFESAVVKVILGLIFATHLWFYLALSHSQVPRIDALPDTAIPYLLTLLVLGGIVHEFGHAAALARYGGSGAEIGIALYICFPAFFVDLSEAWRLSKRQRVVIDLGGLYFQALVLMLAAGAFAVSGDILWACFFVITDIQIAANLNPLLRLDGYWALADGLGIPNLRRRSIQQLLMPMLLRKRQSQSPQTSSRVIRTMWTYLGLSVVFSVYLACTLYWQCSSILSSYPAVLQSAVTAWQTRPVAEALLIWVAALWRGLLLLGVALMLNRALVWIIRQARLRTPAG